LETNFWLICGLWVALGTFVVGKVKSKKLVDSGEFTKEEVNKYLLNFAIWISVPVLTFWVLQLSLGAGASFELLVWPMPQKFIAVSILISLWTYLLVWTLFLGGVKPLGRCLRLISNFPESMLSPTILKGIVILIVASGVASLFMKRV